MDIFALLSAGQAKEEIATICACNDKTERFGLVLTEDEARELCLVKNESLKVHQRVEFGESILSKLIFEFCDSEYLNQDNYADTLKQLQNIFYKFKNESGDKVTDDELLTFMREQFDGVCYGDITYLEETCLPRFAAAIRAGYRGHQSSGGHGEYLELDEEQRWDSELYHDVLKEMFWE